MAALGIGADFHIQLPVVGGMDRLTPDSDAPVTSALRKLVRKQNQIHLVQAHGVNAVKRTGDGFHNQ
jgi:hypothetical protein